MTDYTLSKGSHPTPDAGRCAMEWVAYLAGEPHSDEPVCVSPLLKEFCISLNDALPDNTRQKMRPLLARTIGTAGDGMDEHRSWLATDWLVREYVPAFMELTPALKHHAEVLRALPPVLAAEALDRAMIGLSVARTDAAAARAAARAAAGAAARDAAGAALAPTVERLQLSALGLLDRMLPGEIVRVPVAADWRELVQA